MFMGVIVACQFPLALYQAGLLGTIPVAHAGVEGSTSDE